MRVFVAIVLLFLPAAAFAQTEKRVALLIGNSFQTAFASGIARELQKHVAILEREITVQPPKRRQCHCRARHHPKNILCIQIYCWRSTILRARCWRRRWLASWPYCGAAAIRSARSGVACVMAMSHTSVVPSSYLRHSGWGVG